jgi:magnesium transporter
VGVEQDEIRDIDDLLRRGDLTSARRLLDDASPQELRTALRRLAPAQLLSAFALLTGDKARMAFEALGPATQTDLIRALGPERAADLFSALEPDDRAALLDKLDTETWRRLLATLDAGEQAMTVELAGYEQDTAGRAMSPEVVAVRATSTTGEAIERVRREGIDAETVYMLPVVDEDDVVLGVISLRRLLFSPSDTPVSSAMTEQPVTVRVDENAETAARLVRSASLIAAPVVDEQGRLAGVLTVDDAMRILAEAEDEDAARTHGANPLRASYGSTPVLGLVKSRLGWLLILIVAATLTVNVLDYFEDTLAQVVTLALFVPLLIGTGGNAGAQSATTVVRAMAVGDVTTRDLPRVVLREVSTGLLLGGALALVAVAPAAFFADWGIALVVCLSLVIICVLATGVGSMTPILARALGVDPAVVSAPLISTFVDASGLIVYFLIARAVLGL